MKIQTRRYQIYHFHYLYLQIFSAFLPLSKDYHQSD